MLRRKRLELTAHLRTLARVAGDVRIEGDGIATFRAVLDAIETRYPVLRLKIRDHDAHVRRPYVRFFSCHADLLHAAPETPLPAAVLSGAEPLLIVGAMAGG